ncbi:MAG: transglycosylase domain-containing protein [Planctomycetota bacterium]
MIRRLLRASLLGLSLLALLLGAEQLLDRCCPFQGDAFARFGESSRVYAADGTLLRVTPTPLGERLLRVMGDEVSPHLVSALLAAEDERFRSHSGVDPGAVCRAAITNLIRGRVVSGASTLTMQLARIGEPRPRTMPSKIIETFRARQLERQFSKDELLTLYLNLAPFGGTLRGVDAASSYWFGKQPADLAPEEAAALIALLPAPSRRSPRRFPDQMLSHRNFVLDRMLDCRFLSESEHARARSAPLGMTPHPWPFLAPHACEVLLREERGPVVYSNLDTSLQRSFESVLDSGEEIDTDAAALVALRRSDGALCALVGSRDYETVQLNTATCRRAAGSTLKPFLYDLALSTGVTGLRSPVEDTPTAFGEYRPKNFRDEYSGSISAGRALVESRNLPAVNLLERVGVDRFRERCRELGLPVSGRPWHLDSALGTMSVSPLELARAYVRFAGQSGSARKILSALASGEPLPGLSTDTPIAWKTGTSAGHRDAWCIAITEKHVLVAWLGNLDGEASPNLIGIHAAAPLVARLVPFLQ